MSQLHVGNQQFFRQYAPDSELPLESRIFTTEYEQGNRQRGDAALTADFTSAMDFIHLRMPVTARFIDEFGNSVRSPEEVSSFALRNRADRAFRNIECNLNGFRSQRNPGDLAWEEYLVTDDEYGLNLPSEGVPINSVQLASATQVGRQQVRRISYSSPVSGSHRGESKLRNTFSNVFRKLELRQRTLGRRYYDSCGGRRSQTLFLEEECSH